MIEGLEEFDQYFGLLAELAANNPEDTAEEHEPEHVGSLASLNLAGGLVAHDEAAAAVVDSDLFRVIGGLGVLEAGGHNVVRY